MSPSGSSAHPPRPALKVPLVTERVTFPAGGVHLQGRLTYPEEGTPEGGVLLLPPHPHFAGDLDNNVIRALERGLGASSLAVLAFNYRGIGGSGIDLSGGPPSKGPRGSSRDGSIYDYWERVERETRYEEIVEDAEAAWSHLIAQLPLEPPLHLVGYSFGAVLAALLTRARRDDPPLPASLSLVAPPIRRYPLPFLDELPLPRLLLLASEDFLYGEAEIAALEELPLPRRVEVIPGADHFFRGREDEAAHRVATFVAGLRNSLSPASDPATPLDPSGGTP